MASFDDEGRIKKKKRAKGEIREGNCDSVKAITNRDSVKTLSLSDEKGDSRDVGIG